MLVVVAAADQCGLRKLLQLEMVALVAQASEELEQILLQQALPPAVLAQSTQVVAVVAAMVVLVLLRLQQRGSAARVVQELLHLQYQLPRIQGQHQEQQLQHRAMRQEKRF